MKKATCLLVCCFAIHCYSQNNYTYKAALEEVTATGFYKINLPPGVIAKCKAGLEDIRLYDDTGSQVSYIIKNDLPVFKNENFIEFPVIKVAKEKDKLTHIILQNTYGKPVDKLLLFIKNMDAYRSFSITGSDDSTHWFIIKENVYLENTFNNDGANSINAISFPKSNYNFFELIIQGENVLPFNIIKAGTYKEDVSFGKYVTIPSPLIHQKDSADKESYVYIQFNDYYQVNKIVTGITGAKFFKRKFTLSTVDKNSYEYLTEGYLVSDSANGFLLNSKARRLLLTIDNEDNIPLKVSAIEAFQLNTSLLAYLQAGKKYYICFGDSVAQFPKYDLEFFKDSIDKTPMELSLKNIERNVTSANAESVSSKNGRIVLWIVITVVLLIVSFFTYKMLKEVSSKKQTGE